MHHRRIGDDNFGEEAGVPSPFLGGRQKFGICRWIVFGYISFL